LGLQVPRAPNTFDPSPAVRRQQSTVSNPDDPQKDKPQPRPDIGATVAWNPADIPGFPGNAADTESAAEPPAPPQATPPPAPPAPPMDIGATVAWNPADIPGFASNPESAAALPPAAPPAPPTPPAEAPAAATPPAPPTEAPTAAAPPAPPAAPPTASAPPVAPPDSGATMAWNPEDLAKAAQEEAAKAEEEYVDPLVGTLLRGKWMIKKRLGAGAFGTVYKVEDVAGGWMEALKILSVDKLQGAEGEAMKKRFLREAQIMQRLGKESKHIVGLSSYEDDFDAGLIYLVMEYVDGRPLSNVVAEEGPFSVERTIHVALQVCDALIAAHAEPVVHRDMKLENVMMTTDRSGNELCKVLDFGIAKIAEKETDSRLTTVGTLGTPGYAAPEQLRAEPVDARTDLFAFGVILYELLTGQDPWLGNPAHTSTTQIYDLMVLAERGEVRPWEQTGVDVPPAMQNVVMKLLRREPDQRYQTAQELADALKRVLEGAAVSDAGSLRVLTDVPGIQVEVRSGRSVVANGPTPLVANGLSAGSYKIRVIDERYEPVETTVTLDAGAMEDLTIVTQARTTGVSASARRSPLIAAAVALLVLGGGGAAVLQPWGRTLDVAGLEGKASSVTAAWLSETGVEGQMSVGPLPAPFKVPLDDNAKAAAVSQLRAAGLNIDTSWEVGRLAGLAGEAQARMRYFGASGDDVRSYAERIASLDPKSEVAPALLRKVAERMAWDAEAARADGASDQAQTLIQECLALVPEHPRCLSAGGDG